ncbi:MAG: Citrate synthase (si), partial [uncultured Phycisphaerae bacterium]
GRVHPFFVRPHHRRVGSRRRRQERRPAGRRRRPERGLLHRRRRRPARLPRVRDRRPRRAHQLRGGRLPAVGRPAADQGRAGHPQAAARRLDVAAGARDERAQGAAGDDAADGRPADGGQRAGQWRRRPDQQRGRRQPPQGRAADGPVPDRGDGLPPAAEQPATDRPGPIALAGGQLPVHDEREEAARHARAGDGRGPDAARRARDERQHVHRPGDRGHAGRHARGHHRGARGAQGPAARRGERGGHAAAAAVRGRRLGRAEGAGDAGQQAEGGRVRAPGVPHVRPAGDVPAEDEQAARRGGREHEVVRDERAADPDPAGHEEADRRAAEPEPERRLLQRQRVLHDGRAAGPVHPDLRRRPGDRVGGPRDGAAPEQPDHPPDRRLHRPVRAEGGADRAARV